MTKLASRDAPRSVESPGSPPAYRYDLDGLRALAVLLIVVYHVWVGRVSGGVDVFLMLSAFFLTASFLRRVDASARLHLRSYWTKTFKRLVPAAAVVLVAVLVATWALLPATRWPAIWEQTWASLLYYQNWELARTAVDYYAPHGALLSPLQHFWSMSIQGQAFVLWPLLIAGGYALARSAKLQVRHVLLAVFGAVFTVSFAYSIVITAADREWAYFDTGARLWEFALGSLLALLMPLLRLPELLRVCLGWLGIAGILFCGVLFDMRGGFPGYLALWPTMSAAAVIIAGAVPTRLGPDRLLAFAPLRRLGNSAYALYLVHWPILVFWIVVNGRDPGVMAGTAIVLASVAAAVVLHRVIERPLRDAEWANLSRRRGVAVVVASAVLTAVPLALWQARAEAEATALMELGNHPGARALAAPLAETRDGRSSPVPAATALDEEWVRLSEPCSGRIRPIDEAISGYCWQNDVSAPTATVVVVGDSHSEQMMGAVLPVAEREGWQLVSVLKGGCSLGIGPGARCSDWSAAVLDYLERLRPAAVITVGTAAEVSGPGEMIVPGFDRAVHSLLGSGIGVIAIRDNPRFDHNMYECAIAAAEPNIRCGVELKDALALANPLDTLGSYDRLHLVDFTEQICPDGQCVPLIGNVYVYLDDNHLTGTYAETLSDAFASQVAGRIASRG